MLSNILPKFFSNFIASTPWALGSGRCNSLAFSHYFLYFYFIKSFSRMCCYNSFFLVFFFCCCCLCDMCFTFNLLFFRCYKLLWTHLLGGLLFDTELVFFILVIYFSKCDNYSFIQQPIWVDFNLFTFYFKLLNVDQLKAIICLERFTHFCIFRRQLQSHGIMIRN